MLSPAEQAVILRWREEGPALFAQEALGAEPTQQQWEASRELVARRRVSIRSGHGTGKTTFEAWCVLWFMSCYFPAKIPCTAPTGHQLDDVLWAEIAKWHRALKERYPQIGDEFEWKSDKFELRSHPRESFAVARTSRPENPEALQGFHSDNILFLIDEASGIPEVVFQVAEGALSSDGAFVLMAANPTRMDGYFYDSHHKMRGSWAALHWNGEESPLVSKSYIEDMAKRYGRESAIYKIRVRGEFAGNPDGVISLDLITSAQGREVAQFGDEIWGLDVARFGSDRTALCKRSGNKIREKVKWWAGKDTMQTVGLLKQEYDDAKKKPSTIVIDVIGIGAGVVDRALEIGLPVVGCNVAEAPASGERYNRLRDELWFKSREWLETRAVSMPDDEDLAAELTMPTYKVLSTGKIQVESKEEIKKRGVVSPDLADSMCLTFYHGRASAVMKPLEIKRRYVV